MAIDIHRGKPLVQLLKLIVAFVSMSLGVFLGYALAQEDCDAADVVLGRGEEHLFIKNNVETYRSQINLFVKVESNFEGFSAYVQDVGGTGYTAWFPAENKCFPDKDTWYQLLTFAKKNSTTIIFGFETKTCRRECKKEKASQSLQQQSVVPRGASRWLKTFPKSDCTSAMLDGAFFSGKLPTCAEPPVSMSTYTIIGIVILVLGTILLLGLTKEWVVKFIKK